MPVPPQHQQQAGAMIEQILYRRKCQAVGSLLAVLQPPERDCEGAVDAAAGREVQHALLCPWVLHLPFAPPEETLLRQLLHLASRVRAHQIHCTVLAQDLLVAELLPQLGQEAAVVFQLQSTKQLL